MPKILDEQIFEKLYHRATERALKLLEPLEHEVYDYLCHPEQYDDEYALGMELYLRRCARRDVYIATINSVDGDTVYLTLWDENGNNPIDASCLVDVFHENGIVDIQEGMTVRYEIIDLKGRPFPRVRVMAVEPTEEEVDEEEKELEDIYDF